MIKEKLLKIRNDINTLIKEAEKEELAYITTMEDDIGKYKLYLFSKNTEKNLNWWDAAKYCNELGGNLPTIKELNYLYENHTNKFEYIVYWSSTDINDNVSFSKNLYFGRSDLFIKTLSYNVRAVRRIYI